MPIDECLMPIGEFASLCHYLLPQPLRQHLVYQAKEPHETHYDVTVTDFNVSCTVY